MMFREYDSDEADGEDGWDDIENDSGEDSGDESTLPCPSCRREILEDSPRCPYCGRYLTEEDHAGPGKPVWVIATALVCLAMAVWWVLAAF